MDDIMKKLDEVIETDIESLNYLDPHSEEHTKTADNVVKLLKLKIEEERLKKDRIDQKIHRIATYAIEVLGIVLPLGFYWIWMVKGFKFEEEGTITSKTFKDLIRFFKPTKK